MTLAASCTSRRRLRHKQPPPVAASATEAATAEAAELLAHPQKRRRLSCKQPPPPEGLFPQYDVTQARAEHIEAFGGVYGKVWVARSGIGGGLRWLKQVKSHSWQDGLPEHGIREVAILKDLATNGQMPHVMAIRDVLAPREVVSQCHRLHIVADHASHDLVTYVGAQELTLERVRSLSWQMTRAVEYLHAHGVLHRNLKPASILICRGGRLVVGGFETAIRCPPEGAVPMAPRFILRTHIAVRAPELLLGLGQDHSGMDVWALGCCVGFLALGGSVFQPEDNTDEAACQEIFQRLGKPSKDHPLAALPCFHDFDIPCQEPVGLGDAEPLLGAEGLSFLSRLLDLDYIQRVTAESALSDPYFADEEGYRDLATGSSSSSSSSACPLPVPPAKPRSSIGGRASEAATPGEDRLVSAWVHPRKPARRYLERDLQREHENKAWCRATLAIVHHRLHRISGLCQHVWSFLMRPRHPMPDFILPLTYIKEWMRSVLVDWLVDVHWKWQLQPAALQLAVNLIDRYLERNPALPTNRFQLLGVAALFLAAKVEDEHYDTDMSATTLALITDRAYTDAEVLDMEAALATAVDFEAPSWGAYHFLCCCAALAPLQRRYFYVAQCYIEHSLCIYSLSRLTPSLLASGSYYLAARLASEQSPPSLIFPQDSTAATPRPLAPAWPPEVAREMGRTEEEVRLCAEEIAAAVNQFHNRADISGKRLAAVKTKFGRPAHLRAADLVWPDDAESPA